MIHAILLKAVSGLCKYILALHSINKFCIRHFLIRDLSEISRGEGGWKQREGHNFLRLQKREGS